MFGRAVTCALWLLATLAFGAVPPSVAGQEFSHRVWGLEDGLPNGRVQALTQTSDGYLWVGTAGGLVRFDGRRFVIFDRSNTPRLADDSILSLLAARDGSLWVGTEGGGLVHYQDGQFTRYSGEHGLTNLFVRSLFEDRDGSLWVGTDRGLFRKSGPTLTRLDGTPEIPYINGLHISEESPGSIVIAGNGLYRVQNGGLVRESTQRGVRAILPRPDGSRWVTTFDGLFEWQGNLLVRIHPELSTPGRLLDKGGATWIGTDRGLFVANGSRVSRHPASDSLPDDSILALYCDREKSIWVGTRNGLARLSNRLVTTHTGTGNGAVFSVYTDPHSRLWLIADDGTLYERVGQQLVRRPVEGPSSNPTIRTVFEDKSGCFWVGTATDGFFRTRCGPLQAFNMATGLRNNSTRAFLQDRAGQLWVATGSGLVRLNESGLRIFYTDEGLAYGSVRSLLEDRNGDLWVGTDGGLSRMRNGKFMQDAVVKRLVGERIWSLHQDSTGSLWIGTRGGGLFRIAGDRVDELGSDAGLPRSIYQILEDASGNLWMSGPSGIVRATVEDLNRAAALNHRVFKVVTYGGAEGMPSVQMSGGFQPAGTISADGKVWFATGKGAVAIETDAVPVTHIPTAFVEQVLIDGKSANFRNGVRVPPGTSRVDIQFTAPNLLSPERIVFWYKLDGFDRDWTYTSASRATSYTSLPPGNYTFRLIARNQAAPDQPSEANLELQWQPRFSQTGWAWALALLFVALLVWLGFWFYARQTKQRYALLIAERARLAREMHDTVLQGCVGVSTLLEAASSFEKTDPSILVDLMNRARNQVRITLDEARQAVWDLRHDSLEAALHTTLKIFTEHLSDETRVPIHVEVVGDPVKLASDIDRNLFAAAREAVRNAVTHGKPKSVKVLLLYSPERVRIEVIDDGIGFESGSPPIADGHYGLLGMRERMEQLGGSLRLSSGRSQGTRVIAELPLSGGGRA